MLASALNCLPNTACLLLIYIASFALQVALVLTGLAAFGWLVFIGGFFRNIAVE